MTKEELRRSLRLASKENRLGDDAECRNCGASDLRVLQWTDGELICADCRLDKQGKSRTEDHHPAGIKNDPFTIPMTANDHAIFSDYQMDWPNETLKNPKGDILHRHAAWERANYNFWMRKATESEKRAQELEELAEDLEYEFGADWWERIQKRRKGGEE